jgi:hypothetical protein
MSLGEQQIETSGDISDVHGMVLEALTRKGYAVQQDSTTKIVADQPFSSAYYAHSVEVDLIPGQIGNVIITLRIDNAMSALYIDRLVRELKNILSISQTQAVSTTVLSQEPSAKKISAHPEVNEPIPEFVAQPEDNLGALPILNISSPFNGMSVSEYISCINSLELLEGEAIRLQYYCCLQVIGSRSMWGGKQRMESDKGFLVFTDDNMIFMQKEERSSKYVQALRIPLESIVGLVTGGILLLHIQFAVGVIGASQQYKFSYFQGIKTNDVFAIRAEIERHLIQARENKKHQREKD